MSLKDRIATRRFGEALVSPSAIVSTGVGAAAGILAFATPVGAIAGAVLFFAGRMAVALRPTGPPGIRIDPFQLDEPWRKLTQDALAAKSQFAGAVKSTPAGPLRDRLAEIGKDIDANVDECWRAGRAGQQLSVARSRLDPVGAAAELAGLGPLDSAPPGVRATAEALQSQLATAQRMDGTINATRDQLRLLNARLDDAVTRSIELSVSSAPVGQIDQVGQDVAGITQEMEALRQALEVTSSVDQTGRTATS